MLSQARTTLAVTLTTASSDGRMAHQCKTKKTLIAWFCSVSVIGFASISPASADTLAEAIAAAYETNPTLQSQRAQLRGIDESYVQARSQYGPTVTVQTDARYTCQSAFKSDPLILMV